MDEITQIVKSNKLYLIEDCAQSHGASFKNKKVGTFGDLGCFSFYPGKTGHMEMRSYSYKQLKLI